MIESDNKNITTSKQLELLDLNSSSYYYKEHKNPDSPRDSELKVVICNLYKIQPAGYRVMHGRVQLEGYIVGEKVIRRLMNELHLIGPYPKRNLSKRNQEHKIYPYLLRDLPITHIDQVWATDITYITMDKGTAYLLAVIDLYSRKIQSWRISNTLSTEFCIAALKEALDNYGPPEIFNTDQGSQFTSNDFTKVLLDKDIKISMDGKGRALDNIFIERFWRTIKYDYIFLNDVRTMPKLKKGVSWFIDYYNRERPHLSLNKRTPDAMYFHGYWELISS
jgi:putative transposase